MAFGSRRPSPAASPIDTSLRDVNDLACCPLHSGNWPRGIRETATPDTFTEPHAPCDGIAFAIFDSATVPVFASRNG